MTDSRRTTLKTGVLREHLHSEIGNSARVPQAENKGALLVKNKTRTVVNSIICNPPNTCGRARVHTHTLTTHTHAFAF